MGVAGERVNDEYDVLAGIVELAPRLVGERDVF
jgi:hypothetical protein